MRLLLHQFLKDCRSLRWMLALWGALILLQSLLVGTAGLGPGDWVLHLAYKLLASLVPMLQTLLLLVLVPLLVHEEPLVGTTAAWLTRPISRPALLASKALFAFAVLVAPPLLAELAVLAANGVSPADLALAAAEIAFTQSAWIVAAAAVAVLTPGFARYAIWAIAIGAVSMLVGLGLGVAELYADPEKLLAWLDPERARVREISQLAVSLLVGAAVVVHQYLTRRTARSVVMVGLGLLALAVAPAVWPWVPRPRPAASAADPARVEFSLNPESVHAIDAVSLRPSASARKSVYGAAECKGLPPASFCRLVAVQGVLRYPDGEAVTVRGKASPLPLPRFDRPALQAALDGSAVLGASVAFTDIGELFEVDGAVYAERATIPARLEGEATLALRRYRVTAELPLRPGSSSRSGSEHVLISNVLQGRGSCRVLLRERKVRLLFSPSAETQPRYPVPSLGGRTLYLLHNKERRQALLPAPDFDWSDALASGGRLTHDIRALDFKVEGSRPALPELDEEWLREAVLARVETVDLGSIGKPILVAGFEMESSGGIESLTGAVSIEPGLRPAEYYERGARSLEDGLGRDRHGMELVRAGSYLEKAIAGDPENASAHTARALLAAAVEPNARKRRSVAQAWLERARAIRPDDPASQRVEAYLVDRDDGDPEPTMQALLVKEPRTAAYWRDLGYFRGRRHQLKRALEAFDRALALSASPLEKAWALERRGDALEEAGRSREAAEAYAKAVSLRSDHAPSLTRLCELSLGAGECERGRSAAARALELEEDTLARSCLLRARICLGALDEGSAAVRRASGLDLIAIGDFYRDRAEHAKARSYYSRLKAEHGGAPLVVALSELELREGDAAAAWVRLPPALGSYPEDGDVLAQAAAVAWARGEKAAALEHAARALEARTDRRTLARLDRAFGAAPDYRRLRARVTERVEALFGYYEAGYDRQGLRRDNATAQWVIGLAGATHKDTKAVPFLIPYVAESAFAETRAKAADALWYIGDRRAVPTLIAALGDPSLEVRGFAASGLGDIGDPAAVGPLLELFASLPDNREQVKARAADALGKLGDPRATGPIRESLATIADPSYRQWAQGALDRLQRR